MTRINTLLPNSILVMIILLTAVVPLTTNAQRVEKVNGKATFILTENDNLTLKEAKIKCVEQAKAEAIQKEFGSLVMSDFINSDKIVDNETSSFYIMDTSTSVKGEWLGDDREPEINIEYVNGELIFTAEVWGRAREIIRANTDVSWQVQKDIEGKKINADEFDTGDRFFVKFRSPSDGYVAIYLITADNETACLLPYRKDNSGRYQIKGGKEYVFFDKTLDPAASYYKLSTNKLQEYNQLVMIYSPNPFTKCTDTSVDSRHPNSLDQKDFAKWLLNNQRADKEMMVNRKWLTIKGTE